MLVAEQVPIAFRPKMARQIEQRRADRARGAFLNREYVIERDAKVQLSVTGKGGKTRQVLLPQLVSASLLALRRRTPPVPTISCSPPIRTADG